VPRAVLHGGPAAAGERLPWQQQGNGYGTPADQDYGGYSPEPNYQPAPPYGGGSRQGGYGHYGSSYYDDEGGTIPPPPGNGSYQTDDYGQSAGLPRSTAPSSGYSNAEGYGEPAYQPAPPPPYGQEDGGFTADEIKGAGHRFFGKITGGLASVIEHAFESQGQPNGYILGEEGGGAFVAGLRYGEGVLYTRDAGTHKVYWQGPSIGYDFGAEGSKTMILVYNLRSPAQIFQTFGGVGGQAYVVGGVGINYLAAGDIKLAPIRSGLGLRLGANVGYLKYTNRPTWNPF
jgi:hypothetical protein